MKARPLSARRLKSGTGWGQELIAGTKIIRHRQDEQDFSGLAEEGLRSIILNILGNPIHPVYIPFMLRALGFLKLAQELL
jgi:hypothetical protein